MTSEPLAARLLDYIQLRHSTFSPEMQRFLRHAATPGYHPGEHMLAAWEQSLPQELRFAKPNQRSSNIEPLLWTLIAPVLAWNYEQPWGKSIDVAETCNYWSRVQKAESLSKSVAFSSTLLAGICAIQSSFPKKIQTALLDHWLDPANDIWTPQGMVASSSYLQTQIAARVSLNWMCSNAPKQSKLGPPAKRWADNVQKLLNALPVGAQRQHIEMFLKSALPIVEKVRAARCADPGVWLAMAPQLLPILPNNEWTRYDLLPVRTPTAKLSASVCGKNHRALARLYAPTLTQTIDALTTDEEWANPGMIRQLVAKTYAAAKTTGIHAEQFELPADVGGELFF